LLIEQIGAAPTKTSIELFVPELVAARRAITSNGLHSVNRNLVSRQVHSVSTTVQWAGRTVGREEVLGIRDWYARSFQLWAAEGYRLINLWNVYPLDEPKKLPARGSDYDFETS
jgi:hypothetical protein